MVPWTPCLCSAIWFLCFEPVLRDAALVRSPVGEKFSVNGNDDDDDDDYDNDYAICRTNFFYFHFSHNYFYYSLKIQYRINCTRRFPPLMHLVHFHFFLRIISWRHLCNCFLHGRQFNLAALHSRMLRNVNIVVYSPCDRTVLLSGLSLVPMSHKMEDVISQNGGWNVVQRSTAI